MTARPAASDDAAEIRLAALMFSSMGADVSGEQWTNDGQEHVRRRLGDDLGAFVVDDPDRPGHLAASAAGTVSTRLPTPFNPSGLTGYVQWVCVDPEHRGKGLGREVMHALLEWFDDRDVSAIELHSTQVAEELYLSLGFSDDGPRALRRRNW